MDLDSYASSAERFLTALDREYHLHFSGQKRDYEVEAIYERHAALFERHAVEALRDSVAGAGGEERRRAAHLLELAVGGYLGRACAAEEAAIAAREAELELEVDGTRIPYRSAPVAQANEPDPDRRRQIEEARLALLSELLNPLHLSALRRSHELIVDLGWPSYADAYAELRGFDLRELGEQTRAFLAATDGLYPELLEPELQSVLGFGLAETRRADLARFFRAPALDNAFGAARLIPSFTEAMSGLGLDLGRQPNIILDTEQRPTKTSRAYCAPVRVPQEVYLVVPRVGGREDFAALFHEGGHAQHYANMGADLPVEYRYLGDNSLTESFAFLVEHVTEDPAWLRDALAAEPEPIVAHVRAVRLYFLRRYCAKLAYELELHGPDVDLTRMPERYAELLGGATGIPWTTESWLDDVDGGFYVAAYLRAWALEARWRAALRSRFGERWFADPAAGRWLAGLWREGQRLSAEELLAATTGEELRFEALAGEFAPEPA
jgi:hypothetical protein